MNKMKIANQIIDTNVQGYLDHFDDWSEAFVKKMAKKDGVKLYNDHGNNILLPNDHCIV